MIAANSAPEWYEHILHWQPFGDFAPLGPSHPITFHFLVNDLFMVLFFGIAAKEITESCLPGGSLNPIRKAITPLFATLGGVVGPVIVFFSGLALAFELGFYQEGLDDFEGLSRGWGIPTATDIALAWLVARMVFGAGHSAVSFLLLLAVADDAIGLVIIALFYGDVSVPVEPIYLLLVALGMLVAYGLRRAQVSQWWVYVMLAAPLVWFGLILAHLHPALSLAMIVPFMPGPKLDTGLFVDVDDVDLVGEKEAERLHLHHSPLHLFEHQLKLTVDLGLFFFAFAIFNLNDLTKQFIGFISTIIKIVKKFLEKKEQVLFFLNRRGYAPYLICKNCGYKQICNNCSMYLTFHKNKNKAICHHCSSEKKLSNKCIDKKNCDFIMYGPGVEKIYEEVSKLFPTSKIEIFSSDYMKKKDHTNSLFNRIRNNQVDILVGTQMISKGFNFPKLNCIVVIDADFSGRGYDLRTTEKNIQLYNQLSGRAGRFSSESLIVYQTLSPENITLNELIKNNPDEILKKELISRKENSLPPFCRLIAIIISANNQSLSIEGAREIKTRLSKINGLEIMGPVDSPLLKIKKKFRSRLLIRFNEKSLKQKMVSNLLNSLKISSKIKLTVDVDPVNFG